jgi:hypothetical protein
VTSIKATSYSKATVTRLFIGSVIAAGAGAIVGIAAVWLAIDNGVFVMSGSDIVALQGSLLAWVLLGLGVAGGLAIVGGLIGGLVSWIGALLNTAQLEGKGWFLVLLLLGIFNFGLFGMIAYLVAGPDGTPSTASRGAPVPASA